MFVPSVLKWLNLTQAVFLRLHKQYLYSLSEVQCVCEFI